MHKPQKTFADYLVIAISPVLIMVMVGSLAFFLIEVFYRGEMIHSIRWVMFWFVLAIVLVSRLAIERGKERAWLYGGALAAVTWFYLVHTYRDPFFGILLLAITWWCAHRVTVDCTLIKEDEDASGEGVLRTLWTRIEDLVDEPRRVPPRLPPHLPPPAAELIAMAKMNERMRRQPRPPGRWIIYFSLLALPLFGLGQLLLPREDPAARRTGFAFLALYLCAGLCLLMTTSFLGLRRYLRQRLVEMPTNVALSWIRFGVILTATVLAAALMLPRPDASKSKNIELTYRMEHQEHNASDYALPFNPPGQGEGAPNDQPESSHRPGVQSPNAPQGNGTRPARIPEHNPSSDGPSSEPNRSDQGTQPGPVSPSGEGGRGEDSTRSEVANSAPPPAQVPNVPAQPDSPESQRPPRTSVDSASPDTDGNGSDKPTSLRPPGNESTLPGTDHPSRMQPGQAHEQQRRSPVPTPTPIDQPPQNSDDSLRSPKPPTDILKTLLRALLFVVIASLLLWVVIRFRKAIADAARAFLAAVREFFRKLLHWRRSRKPAVGKDLSPPVPVLRPFVTYEDPFANGNDRAWPPERLLFYTYDALQAWAKEQRIVPVPQETPREFCDRVMERFPDFGPELEQFSFYYSYAAFATCLPADFDREPVRRLWQYLGDSVMVVAGR